MAMLMPKGVLQLILARCGGLTLDGHQAPTTDLHGLQGHNSSLGSSTQPEGESPLWDLPSSLILVSAELFVLHIPNAFSSCYCTVLGFFLPFLIM